VPLPSFSAVAEAAVARQVDFGVLPIESSLVGPVNETHDLLYELPLSIVDETALRIRHCLVANEPVALEEIHEVHSHPVALDQCRSTRGGNLERACCSAARTCSARRERGRSPRVLYAVRCGLDVHAPRSAQGRVEDCLQLRHRSLPWSAPPRDRALRATRHRSRATRVAADPLDPLALPIRCSACRPSPRSAGTRRHCRSPGPGSDAASFRLVSGRRRARGRVGVTGRLTRLSAAPTLATR
jgi:hypothetical protein